MKTPPIIIGISGASGIVYGIRLLEVLRDLGQATHLIMSKSAKLTLAYESDYAVKDIEKLATSVHAEGDLAASVSSGSFITRGMVIAPCSVRSMSEISTGVTSTLLTRAADVTLKERRTLILMVRETPLHLGHLRTMASLSEMGAIIMPPVPAFYTRPETIDDIVDHTVGRTLDLLGLTHDLSKRWKGTEKPIKKG